MQVRLAQDGAGRALRFARIVRGDIFGETEFLAAGLDPKAGTRITIGAGADAGRASIGYPWTDLAALFEIDPAIRTRFLKLAARRLLDAVWAQHSQGHEDPDIVLADWLVEYAADLGVAASNRVSFPRKLNQTEIADELGVSRETISRRLKEWERSGLVISSAAGLEVVDYSRLVRIAGLHSGRDRAALARAVADVAARDRPRRPDRRAQHRRRHAALLPVEPGAPAPDGARRGAERRPRRGDGDPEGRAPHRRGRPRGAAGARRARARKSVRADGADRRRATGSTKAFDDDDGGGDARRRRAVERLIADLAALEARLLKDQAFEAGDGASAAPSPRTSYRAYAAIWRRVGNWYAGVNAAAMALAAGDTDGGAKARQGNPASGFRRSPKDYWAAATRAEALFLIAATARRAWRR